MSTTTKQKPTVKIVLYGKEGIGKSALMARYIYGEFDSNIGNTIGSAFYSKDITVDNRNLFLNIWDTAGSERYYSMLPMYTRGAKIVLVCFEQPIIEEVNFQVHKIMDINIDAKIFLVATKTDICKDCNYDKITKYAQTNRFKIFFTSAFTGEGVSELFEEVAITGKDFIKDEEDNGPLRITSSIVKKPSTCCWV